jgi:hypothetical protein
MKVGCIHEVLSYCRFHIENANKNIKACDHINKQIKANFIKLGMYLSDEDIDMLRPWSGKIDENKIGTIKNILKETVEINTRINIYDRRCLEHAFDIRLQEAASGILPEEIFVVHEDLFNPSNEIAIPEEKRHGFLYRLLRKLIMPLWQSIHFRLYQPLQRIDQNVNSLQGLHLQIETLIEQNNKLLESLALHGKHINKILSVLEGNKYD